MATAKHLFTLKRLGTSPYFQGDFLAREKAMLSHFGTFLEIDQKPQQNNDQKLIYITNTHSRLESLSEYELKNLALIVHPNSGYDNFSSPLLQKIKAPIILGNPIRAHAVAEYILGGVFSHFTPIPTHRSWSIDRKWERTLLHDCTVCLIGKGHIGSLLKETLAPLVKSFHIYDPYLEDAQYHNLNCKNAKVLIIAAELNDQNIHLVDNKILDMLSPEALIINAARGKLINTSHLKKFLLERPNSYAILDVFENEPCDFATEFQGISNLQLTSHIAGVYPTIAEKTLLFEKNIIEDFIHLNLEHFLDKYKSLHLQDKLNKWNQI